MQYITKRRLAVVMLAASLTLALGTQLVALGAGLSAIVILFLAHLMYRNHGELRTLHQRRETEFAVPKPNDAITWRTKPRLSDMAPGFLILGILILLWAYNESQAAYPPSRGILRWVYELLGPIGLTGVYCCVGVAVTVYGVEMLVARRLHAK